MTAVQAVRHLLEQNWTNAITGRSTDVPTPAFVEEKSEVQQSIRTNDVVHITDGGDLEFEPKGIGFTHEGITSRVSVDIRTADRRTDGVKESGRHRLFGKRAGIASADRYTGVGGEAKRIFDMHRKGFAEFDLCVAGPLRDISGQTGQNHYRAVIDVALIEVAHTIEPSPDETP